MPNLPEPNDLAIMLSKVATIAAHSGKYSKEQVKEAVSCLMAVVADTDNSDADIEAMASGAKLALQFMMSRAKSRNEHRKDVN